MDQILQTLGNPSDSGNGNGSSGTTHPNLTLTSSDLNPNMEDVMKVLTSLDDEFAAVAAASANNSAHADTDGTASVATSEGGRSANSINYMTSEDVSHVVDKVTLANEKILVLSKRQAQLQQRHQVRLNLSMMRNNSLKTL